MPTDHTKMVFGWSATKIIVLTFVAVNAVAPAGCSRILAIETIPYASCWNFMSGVLRALTDSGHSVTAFTPFPDGDRPNYTEMVVSNMFPKTLARSLELQTTSYNGRWNVMTSQVIMDKQNCEILQKDGRLRHLVTSGLSIHFDAVIVEHNFLDCMSRAVIDSGLPLILTVSTPSHLVHERLVTGHQSNPVIVTPLITDCGVPKTLAQRFQNAVAQFYDNAAVAILDAHLRLTDPDVYEMHRPVYPSLMFINNHFISERASPTPTNLVRIGGIHLKPVKPIPKDILEFIEDSNGVILFTFGSTVAVSSIPERIKATLKETFAQLPLKVLMKYEDEMDDKPNNTITSKWFPQRNILMHPKVKLFISHGGISGLYEAVDAGVPVLGFNLFFDQHRNLDNLVESGMAIKMDLFSFTKEELLNNILELISDKKYSKNAKIASKIFNDRPEPTSKLVNYWTEYTIRHKKVSNSKSHDINLTWCQYFLLDIFANAFILICIISFFIIKVFKNTKTLCVFIFTRVYRTGKSLNK